jgi:hypothetical protein
MRPSTGVSFYWRGTCGNCLSLVRTKPNPNSNEPNQTQQPQLGCLHLPAPRENPPLSILKTWLGWEIGQELTSSKVRATHCSTSRSSLLRASFRVSRLPMSRPLSPLSLTDRHKSNHGDPKVENLDDDDVRVASRLTTLCWSRLANISLPTVHDIAHPRIDLHFYSRIITGP